MGAENNSGEQGLKSLKEERVLYCYLDEAGDFNFSPTGSRYYIYTALVSDDPLPLNDEMLEAKYTLVLNNIPFSKSHQGNDYFHATEDAPLTRRICYGAIVEHLDDFRVYSVIVQKNKVTPDARERRAFYSKLMGRLLDDVIAGEEIADNYTHVSVLTDRIPVQKKSSAIIGPVKGKLKSLLGEDVGYSLAPMESRSDFGLQAADYCSWAIYRAWTNDDLRHRNLIAGCVRSERDLLASCDEEYY